MPPIQIADDDLLYRRLAPGHLYPNGAANSNAFKLNGAPDPQISVDLARLTTVDESVMSAGRPGFRVGVLRVGDVRKLGLEVIHDPTDENVSHCIITGNTQRATCTLLAELTKVI